MTKTARASLIIVLQALSFPIPSLSLFYVLGFFSLRIGNVANSAINIKNKLRKINRKIFGKICIGKS